MSNFFSIDPARMPIGKGNGLSGGRLKLVGKPTKLAQPKAPKKAK